MMQLRVLSLEEATLAVSSFDELHQRYDSSNETANAFLEPSKAMKEEIEIPSENPMRLYWNLSEDMMIKQQIMTSSGMFSRLPLT
jgi:hypothetical protein